MISVDSQNENLLLIYVGQMWIITCKSIIKRKGDSSPDFFLFELFIAIGMVNFSKICKHFSSSPVGVTEYIPINSKVIAWNTQTLVRPLNVVATMFHTYHFAYTYDPVFLSTNYLCCVHLFELSDR